MRKFSLETSLLTSFSAGEHSSRARQHIFLPPGRQPQAPNMGVTLWDVISFLDDLSS